MAKKKESLVEQEKLREDLGFGTQVTSEKARLVNPDGGFNVKKLHQSFEARANIYHRLVKMDWLRFFTLVLAFYFLVNMIFGLVYYVIGVKHLLGVEASNPLSDFWEAFFFSSQTLTTVGYGRISPEGYLTSFVAALEALIGLMIFAIMTGLLYGRFSRPNPKILYSAKAIISPYLDINGLMFRIANEKSNQLMNVKVSVILSKNEISNGKIIRKYHTLETERSSVLFLPTAWTVVHPITQKSVLYGQTLEQLQKCDAEIIINLEGTNDTMTDPIHARKSYLYNEIISGAKFKPMLEPIGVKYVLDLSKIDAIDKADLNEY
ncbi:MAG: inward rectifier potassium channel [Arcticibacterium sp.]|jgi:inward rectifier potassium channel